MTPKLSKYELRSFEERYPTFERWYNVVSRECVGISGLPVGELTDQPFRAWYDDQVDPREAAIWALEENDFPFEDAPDLFLE